MDKKKESSNRLGLLTYDVEALEKFKEKNERKDYHPDLPFIVEDVSGLLIEANAKAKILHIYTHEGTIEEQTEAIRDFANIFMSSTNWVVIAESYASIYEFPEDEYYDANDSNKVELIRNRQAGKKPVPFAEVLSKQNAMFKSLGFVDFNFYTEYEFKHAWILNNVLGDTIVEKAKRLQKEFREEQRREQAKNFSKMSSSGCEASCMTD